MYSFISNMIMINESNKTILLEQCNNKWVIPVLKIKPEFDQYAQISL